MVRIPKLIYRLVPLLVFLFGIPSCSSGGDPNEIKINTSSNEKITYTRKTVIDVKEAIDNGDNQKLAFNVIFLCAYPKSKDYPEVKSLIPILLHQLEENPDTEVRRIIAQQLPYLLLDKSCNIRDGIAWEENRQFRAITPTSPTQIGDSVLPPPTTTITGVPESEIEKHIESEIEKNIRQYTIPIKESNKEKRGKALNNLWNLFFYNQITDQQALKILNTLAIQIDREDSNSKYPIYWKFKDFLLWPSTFSERGNNKKTISILLQQLKKESNYKVRAEIISMLGRISYYGTLLSDKDKEYISDALIDAIDGEKDLEMIDNIINSFASIGKPAKKSIPRVSEFLTKKLNASDFKSPSSKRTKKEIYEDICYASYRTLYRIGTESGKVIPEIFEAFKENNENENETLSCRHELRQEVLIVIAERLQQDRESVNSNDLNKFISDLENVNGYFTEYFKKQNIDNNIASVESNEFLSVLGSHRMSTALSSLKDERQLRIYRIAPNIFKFVKEHPWLYGLILVPIVYLGILWLRPRWLLLLPAEFTIPKLGKVSPAIILLLKYRPRVLDAWIADHLDIAHKSFARKNTVNERKVHITSPAILDGKTFSALNPETLKPIFNEKRVTLLIYGEGGSGKTSLACQFAQWAMNIDQKNQLCNHKMLPVLIEQELNFKDSKSPLKEAIKGQLQALIGETSPLSDELLEQLLRHRRILVIVDHFSELSEATRQEIRPGHPDFLANALIITSRIKEPLDNVPKVEIESLRIEGVGLPIFMQDYLTQRNKRELFSDQEFLDACSQLSKIVGQRKTTVMMAKLYAEQMIAKKETSTSDALPSNIPDLMLNYLNELNKGSLEQEFSDRIVHKDAKVIAWECLKERYQPSPANRDGVLQHLGGDNAEARLKHLEEKLRVIQTIGAAQDQIRFSLDPLSEYLAALHLVEKNGDDVTLWQEFLTKTEALDRTLISGFLSAVQDCYEVKSQTVNLPKFVLEELSKQLA